MLYDSNGLKPYIYVLFFKTCPCATQIYILLALHQNPLNINFLGSFRSFSNCRGSFHRSCSAPGPDMSESRVSSLYKGAECPLRIPCLFFLFHSISCSGQGLSRRFWVFSTESLLFLGDLTLLLLRIFKP
jgi:hypothetical protein